MSEYHYLELSNNRKIPIFKQGKDIISQPPKFCNKFIRLWELLYNVGKADRPTFSGTIHSFPSPLKYLSKLTGVPYISSASSIIRMFNFINEDLKGPIINDGYMLETYNDTVHYEIKWNAKKDIDNFIIGFYRSDGFIDNTTNTFSLICGNKGPSIFRQSYGSFISPGISNLFVVTDQDVIIEMEVKVIIPDKIIYPSISHKESYIKYLTIQDVIHGKLKLPAYKISLLGDETSTKIIKEPSRYFIEASTAIKKYLSITGLPVTFIPNTLSICPNYNSSIIKTRQYDYCDCLISCITMITDDTYNPKYYISGIYQGIELNSPKIPEISYEININCCELPAYRVIVKIQYRSSSLLYTHNKLDYHGKVDGYAESTFDIQPSIQGKLVGSFRISETARAFSVTIYYEITVNISDDDKRRALNKLTTSTSFDNITIYYVDKVTSSSVLISSTPS